MRKGFLYLVANMDWFTRQVLAVRRSNTLEAWCCVTALNDETYKFRLPDFITAGQGCQFTSFDWKDCLKRAKIKISKDGKACYLDNTSSNVSEGHWEMNASICTLGEPDYKPGLASGNGSRSTTISGSTPPAAAFFNAT
jgi:hypothetical protein